MDHNKPSIYIFRHGETEWSKLGKHTGLTDLPLTPHGEQEAFALSEKFYNHNFEAVYCSPLQRATKTCLIMGLLDRAIIDEGLVEWNYGDYEGLTTAEIHEKDPQWSVFTHPCPHGETIQEISQRAERMIEKISKHQGDVAIFSSGHFCRILAMRWMNLPAESGKNLMLNTGTYSILSYERNFSVIKIWNAPV